MHTSLRISALAAALAAALPSALTAQECAIDLNQPTQLFQASILIQRAAGEPTAEATPRALRDAARQLQDPKRFEANRIGYAFARAQLYILWLHRPETPATMSLADLNFGRDRATMVDLVHDADSLLTVVETAQPTCKSETQRWRQSKPWSDRIGASYRFLGSNEVDSAEYYARQAGRLDRSSPFLYNAYAQVGLKRGQQETAIAYLDTAITLAAGDTTLNDTRRQMRSQQAQILQEWGGGLADVEARKKLLARAGRQFLAIGHETPSSPDVTAYISTGLEIASLIQDTALVNEGLAPLLANPGAYSDLVLLIGAENARLAGNGAAAMALYRGTLSKNPNSREANYALAYLLIDGNQGEEALPLLDKLIEIDPSNGDSYLLKSVVIRTRVTAVQTRRDAERDPARRQTMLREIRALSAEADSLAARESGMPHKLQVTGFERRAEGARLTGTIDNRGRAAKAYTVEMSFLNAAGEVVETLSATTESVAPGATGNFEITATRPGIVAWRYKPLQ